MSVTAVTLQGNPSLAANDEGHRIYTVLFRVLTNSTEDGPISVLAGGRAFAGSVKLPAAGAVFSFGNDADLYSTCDPIPEIRLHNEDGCLRYWDVTCTYTTVPRKRCQTTEIQNPINEPWDVEGDSDEWTEEARRAYNAAGTKIVPVENSAHQPFVGKAIEVFRTRRRLTLRKNYSSLNMTWIDSYEGGVNNAPIVICGRTYAARQVRIRKISFQRRRWGTCTYYFPTTFQLDLNINTHDLHPVDLGYQSYDDDIGGIANTKDPRGDYKADPDFLDGNGHLLPTGDSPVVFSYRYYTEFDMSIFGFPAS